MLTKIQVLEDSCFWLWQAAQSRPTLPPRATINKACPKTRTRSLFRAPDEEGPLCLRSPSEESSLHWAHVLSWLSLGLSGSADRVKREAEVLGQEWLPCLEQPREFQQYHGTTNLEAGVLACPHRMRGPRKQGDAFRKRCISSCSFKVPPHS